MERIKVGIIGCGNISGIYLTNLTKVFRNVELVGCSDIIPERAAKAAAEYGIKAMTNEEIFADKGIQIVVNLTPPVVHYEIVKQALEAGKNAHTEKPFSVTREQGKELFELAQKKGLLIACAPDTFLGGGLQTCRKLIEDGWIGEPVSAVAFMVGHGHESWHPDPEFFYKPGAGPMFDMGPYYVTALVHLIGRVNEVAGMTAITFKERTITSTEAKFGNKIGVEIPTHITGLMRFDNGAIATLITSFDVWGSNLPRIEIHGTEGSMSVPDPNTFGGPIYVKNYNQNEFKEVPLSHIYAENSRGIGVSDLARAIMQGGKNRASGELAYHVLDVMHAFHDSNDQKKFVSIQSPCAKPDMLPLNLRKGYVC